MAEKYVGAFGVVPNAVLYDERLKNGEKILYTFISSLSNKSGYCFASNTYLSEIVGVTKNTIKIYLKKLEDLNYINRSYKSCEDNDEVERKIYLVYDELFNADEEARKSCQGWHENRAGGSTKIVPGGGTKIGPYNNTSIMIQDNNIRDIESGKSQNYNYDLIVSKYNSIAKECKLTSIYKLSDKRRVKLKARLDEIGEDELLKAIGKIKESSFLIGKNDRNWKISFDWLINNDNNMIKLLEDKYKDDKAADDFAIFDQIGTHI